MLQCCFIKAIINIEYQISMNATAAHKLLPRTMLHDSNVIGPRCIDASPYREMHTRLSRSRLMRSFNTDGESMIQYDNFFVIT